MSTSENPCIVAAKRLAEELGYPESVEKIIEAINNILTPIERQYLMEHYGYGWTQAAIAAAHGVRASTANNNIARGRDKLLRCLIGTPAPAKREHAKAPQFDTAQCKGCYHWRWLNRGVGCGRCCHFLLDTGHRKQVENGKCLSRAEEAEYDRTPFEIPIQQR